MQIFKRRESQVRSYCRSFPTVFQRAQGSRMIDEGGTSYIDFFAGAGALNYGHNPASLRESLLAYIADEGITHSLDMASVEKRKLLETIESHVLAPRGMDYKVMFPGPTGTNAVESALKLARKVTGRRNIVAFTNGFHGMTLGSLAITGNAEKRQGAGVPLDHVNRQPYEGYAGAEDSLALLEHAVIDKSSGVEAPAAFILETVQAEGGVNVASGAWLRRVAEVAKRLGSLLIVDDIQVGCGRTGPFFSFEPYDLQPDIICLSKSLSGYGVPFALNLIRPEYDQWLPGEHNGTFRGHNLAFVTARRALEEFWGDDQLTKAVARKRKLALAALEPIAQAHELEIRGRGLIIGVVMPDGETASRVSKRAFEEGLIIETAGALGEVVKLLPALTIPDADLQQGLHILVNAIERTLTPAHEATPATSEATI